MKKIIIPIIIVLYALLIIVLNSNMKKNKPEKKDIDKLVNTKEEIKPGNYVIYSDKVYKYSDSWKYIGEYTNLFDEKNVFYSTLFDIYINGEYKGKYYLYRGNDKWHYIDENNKVNNYNGILFAVSSSLEYKINKAKEENVTKEEIDLLNTNLNLDIKYIDGFRKYVYDYNKDGKDEIIYSLSNSFKEDNLNTKKFSFIIYFDGQYKKILSNVKTSFDANKKNLMYNYNLSMFGNNNSFIFINELEEGNSEILLKIIDLSNI